MQLLLRKSIGSIRRSRKRRVCRQDLFGGNQKRQKIIYHPVNHYRPPYRPLQFQAGQQSNVRPAIPTRILNRQMLLVAMLQRPRVTIIHVTIVEGPVISLGNVRIPSGLIKIIRRPLPINNRVRHRTRITIRMLRKAKMKEDRKGFLYSSRGDS